MTKEELKKKLIEAKEAYYNDVPIMEDSEFDEFEDKLRQLDPENDYFSIVGIPAQREKLVHKYPMLSAKKAKTINEVQDWLNKIVNKRVDLIIEPKIDGLSCSIVYNKGKLQYMLTRGDGIEGRSITHLSDYMNIPKTIKIKHRIEIRGELYISKFANFPNPENKSLRNLAVGLVNRKNTGLENLKYLSFVGYQILDSDMNTESDKLLMMPTEFQIKSVPYKVIKSIQEIREYFEEYKSSLREKWQFKTDGLMLIINDNSLYEEIDSKYIVDHHHHYNIALKPPSESRWTFIESIEWNVSKNGNIIPVVNITPIIIGGSTIKNVTANNYANVKKLKLNIGDKIHVSKANDVIPFLVETVSTKDKSDLIPIYCPSCDSKLIIDRVHCKCINDNCDEKKIQIIANWIKNLDIDEVAEATVKVLYDNHFIDSIIDLYFLKNEINLLLELDGFGEKKINKMIEEIEKSKNINIIQFLSSLSIPLIGEKAVKKLGIKSEQDFWNFNNSTYKIGQNIIEYREKHKNQVSSLFQILNISNISNIQSKGRVCMTGHGHKGRKELIKEIKDMDYEFVDSITKETVILICEDITGNSSKLQKARKLGIKLMSYEEFFE